jgi:hypothetical protein
MLLPAAVPASAHAWAGATHRAINQLALNSLPADFPGFVREPANADLIVFLAPEPDRWRSSRMAPFRQIVDPQHDFDVEQLTAAGIDPATVTPFLDDFLVQFSAARAAHADAFPPLEPARDYNHLYPFPGVLPWTVAIDYGQLQELFSQWKTFRQYGTPAETAQTESLIVELMGLMGHYVGDSSQPLHVTVHHHGWDCFGWKAPNPHGYSRRSSIHDWIDGTGAGGGFIGRAGITEKSLESRVVPATLLDTAARPDGRDPVFVDFMQFVIDQNKEVEPLYQLDQAGKLKADGTPGSLDGKPFIEAQILKGAQMLGDLWLTAWRSAGPDVYLRSELVQRSGARKAPDSP